MADIGRVNQGRLGLWASTSPVSKYSGCHLSEAKDLFFWRQNREPALARTRHHLESVQCSEPNLSVQDKPLAAKSEVFRRNGRRGTCKGCSCSSPKP